MGLNWPNTNHNYVPAYQQSGIPFVTSSVFDEVGGTTPVRVKFPYVTRWVVVRVTGQDDLRVGFTENGVLGPLADTACGGYHVTASNANYFVLSPSGAAGNNFGNTNMLGPLEIKCTEMWFLASGTTSQAGLGTGFSLMAGYTNIPQNQFMVLTGSSGSNFQGVG